MSDNFNSMNSDPSNSSTTNNNTMNGADSTNTFTGGYNTSQMNTGANANTEYTNQAGSMSQNEQSTPNFQTPNSYSAYSEKDNAYTWHPVEETKAEPPKKIKKAKVKKTKKPMTYGRTLATCIAVALIAVMINSGILYYVVNYSLSDRYATKTELQSAKKISETVTGNAVSTNTTGGSATVTDASAVVSNVMPSIVAITSTTIVNSGYNPFSFGNSGSSETQGAGSGIIIGQNDTELLIVTNNHVVEDTTALSVKFIDDQSVTAYIKGTDSDADLAVVAVKIEDIKEDTLSQIKVATLGDSDKLSAGEGVIAIGNALGYGQSVTTGVISALNRKITVDNKTMTMIQTDAAINGGNSGGALLNMNGEVIGINAAKYSSSSYSSSSIEGMGFSIPISSAKEIISELMTQETKVKVDSDKRGYLGISILTVDSSTAEAYSIPEGVYIRKVNGDGPCDQAGLVKTDVITKINGTSVTTKEELTGQLDYYEAGTTVTLTVQTMTNNEYKEKEVEVTLCDEKTAMQDTNSQN